MRLLNEASRSVSFKALDWDLSMKRPDPQASTIGIAAKTVAFSIVTISRAQRASLSIGTQHRKLQGSPDILGPDNLVNGHFLDAPESAIEKFLVCCFNFGLFLPQDVNAILANDVYSRECE